MSRPFVLLAAIVSVVSAVTILSQSPVPNFDGPVPTTLEAVVLAVPETALEGQFPSLGNSRIRDVTCEPPFWRFRAQELMRVPEHIAIRSTNIVSDVWNPSVLNQTLATVKSPTPLDSPARRRVLSVDPTSRKALSVATDILKPSSIFSLPTGGGEGADTLSNKQLTAGIGALALGGFVTGLGSVLGSGGAGPFSGFAGPLTIAGTALTDTVFETAVIKLNNGLKDYFAFKATAIDAFKSIESYENATTNVIFNDILPGLNDTENSLDLYNQEFNDYRSSSNNSINAIELAQAGLNVTIHRLEGDLATTLAEINNVSNALATESFATAQAVASLTRQIISINNYLSRQFAILAQKDVAQDELDRDRYDLLNNKIRGIEQLQQMTQGFFRRLYAFEDANPELVAFIDRSSMREPSTDPLVVLGGKRVVYQRFVHNFVIAHVNAPSTIVQEEVSFYLNRDLIATLAHSQFDSVRLFHEMALQAPNCQRPVVVVGNTFTNDTDPGVDPTNPCVAWIETRRFECDTAPLYSDFTWRSVADGVLPPADQACSATEYTETDTTFKDYETFQRYFDAQVCTAQLSPLYPKFQVLTFQPPRNTSYINNDTLACGHDPNDPNYGGDLETYIFTVLDLSAIGFEITMSNLLQATYGRIPRGVQFDDDKWSILPLNPDDTGPDSTPNSVNNIKDAVSQVGEVSSASFAGIGPDALLPIYSLEDIGQGPHKVCVVTSYANQAAFDANDPISTPVTITGDAIVLTSRQPEEYYTTINGLDDLISTGVGPDDLAFGQAYDVNQDRICRLYGAMECEGTVSYLSFPATVETLSGLQAWVDANTNLDIDCSVNNLYTCWTYLQGLYGAFKPSKITTSPDAWLVDLVRGPDGFPYCVSVGSAPVNRTTPGDPQDIITPLSSLCQLFRHFQVRVTPDGEYQLIPRIYSMQVPLLLDSGEQLGVDDIANCTAVSLAAAGATAQTLVFTNQQFYSVPQHVFYESSTPGCTDEVDVTVPRHGSAAIDVPLGCANLTIVVSRLAPNGSGLWVTCTSFTAADIEERVQVNPTVPADVQVYTQSLIDNNQVFSDDVDRAQQQLIFSYGRFIAGVANVTAEEDSQLQALEDQVNSETLIHFALAYNFSDTNSALAQYQQLVDQLAERARNKTNDANALNQQAAADIADLAQRIADAEAAKAGIEADIANLQADINKMKSGNATSETTNYLVYILIALLALAFLFYCFCIRGGGGSGGGQPIIINRGYEAVQLTRPEQYVTGSDAM